MTSNENKKLGENKNTKKDSITDRHAQWKQNSP